MTTVETCAIPVALSRSEAGLRIRLSRIDLSDLREPFLMETVVRQRQPIVDELFIDRADLAGTAPARTIGGLIFHTGRCGSTLLAHSLKSRATVLSEPDALANLFRTPLGSWTSAELSRAAAIVFDLFARASARPVIVKLTSWHALFSPEFMAAAPGVPTVFLSRHPSYVATSLAQRSPGWARHWLAAEADDCRQSSLPSPETAQAIADMITAFLERSRPLLKGRHLDLDYDALVAGGVRKVFHHLGLTFDESDERHLSMLGAIDAKDPERSRPFRSATALSPEDWPDLFDHLQRTAIPAFEAIRSRSLQCAGTDVREAAAC